ncbi:MAG: DUF58 domain-containing protein, partial [Novosphingobium sp.]|nr:DUF58 domain-containing protein [Novosphingobium sp.]
MARRSALIVPTQRAVWLLALSAPLALVIAAFAPGTWIVAPALGAVMLALVLADAVAAGRLVDLRFPLPADVEVGAEGVILAQAAFAGGWRSAVRVALDCDVRLIVGGRCTFTLEGDGAMWCARFPLAPVRRGTARIGSGWLRWSGPLGLGARQLEQHIGCDVRIWPNIAAVRSPALQLFLKDSQFGLIARRFRGEGSQFEALSEYRPGMDRRRIDWKASARHLQLLAKEYETERNNQIAVSYTHL